MARANNKIQSYQVFCLAACVLVIVYLTLTSGVKEPSVKFENFEHFLGKNIDSFAAISPIPPVGMPVYHPADNGQKIVLSESQKRRVADKLRSMQRIVHLDLKGAPPSIGYLEQVFPLLRTLGATGLLIEWEDMFPYEGRLVNLSSEFAYTKEQVKRILALASVYKFQVIPLVQTFGHMEFALKLNEFKQLREKLMNPCCINPHLEDSLNLISDMIDQQMALQPDIRYMHIGSDEVYELGTGSISRERMETQGISRETIFLNHVQEVAGYIKNKYTMVEVLMWDDMLRIISLSRLKKSQISMLVTPVVWAYTVCIECRIQSDVWLKYNSVFKSLWFASAFKGASGSSQYITNISYHYDNHMSWLKTLASDELSSVHIEGVFLTGWQRYDHFSALCELFPVGIPSLAVNLALMQRGGLPPALLNSVNKQLGCVEERPIQWLLDTKDRPPPMCSFPGHEVLEAAYEMKNAMYYIGFFNGLAGWHTDYNMKRNFASPSKMLYMKDKCYRGLQHIKNAETIMSKILPMLFNHETLVEWMETYITPNRDFLTTKLAQTKKNLQEVSWPRRPYHYHMIMNGTKVHLV